MHAQKGWDLYLFYFLFQIMVNKTPQKCGIYKRNFLYAQLNLSV